MNDEDRKKMFSYLTNEFARALSGEFDPERGGLKLVFNLEKNEHEMIYIAPVKMSS